MAKYRVKFYEGDYPHRQEQANEDGAICYAEQHFNSIDNDTDGLADNYALAMVGSNASEKSKAWAEDYAKRCAAFNGSGAHHVHQCQPRGRGDLNLRYTSMPAILLEPLFLSDPEQAKLAMSVKGQKALGLILAASIELQFPQGGLVAFSVGHAGKVSNPNDKGCSVVERWEKNDRGIRAPVYRYPYVKEASLAQFVLRWAKDFLTREDAKEKGGCFCPSCGVPLSLSTP